MDKQWLFEENKRLHELSLILDKERKAIEHERELLEADKKHLANQQMVLESGFRTLAADKKAFLDDLKKEWQRKARDSYEEKQIRYERYEEMGQVGPGYFGGVSSKSEIKKRYKQLMKIYHPDNESGDPFTVACINREYELLLKKYEK